MKIKLTLVVILLINSLIGYSQEKINIPEPEYTGRIVYVKNLTESKSLEQQKVSGKVKVGASVYLTGIGKAKGTNIIRGVKSPIRIHKSDKYQFIIRVTDNNIDPFQLINIFKLEQKIKKNKDKSYRFIKTSTSGTFSGTSVMDIKMYLFDSKRYGNHSYLITINEPLDPGEYAITLEGSRNLFNMFGID